MPAPNLFPGTLYIQGFHGVAWSQPGGPNTPVFPQQQNGVFVNYPVPGQFFSETSGLFTAGCGHWMDYPEIFTDYDNATAEAAVLVCCPLCSYIQYLIEPAALFYDPLQFPITLI
jgi:hypothetical protein